MTSFRWGAATDVGRVRDINQDTALIDPEHSVFAVADGMGGHVGGEVASKVAVEALRVNARPEVDALVEAVRVANEAIIERTRAEPDLQGMGTTLCIVALVTDEGEEQVAVLNVGDSRVYVLQQGELLQVSEDHSLVEEMVREGRLRADEARTHPHRHIITRVLGGSDALQVDSWRITPYAGDRYLLCSDGLVDEVPDDRIAATLRRISDPDEAARSLVQQALEAGGRDNVTVVVVDVVDDGGRVERATAAVGAAGSPRTTSRPGGTGATATGQATGASGATGAALHDGSTSGRGGTADDADADRAPLRPRRLTWRVGAFVLAVLALLAGGAAFTAWYARAAYFVAFDDGDTVAIYQGRPGGVLVFDPTLVDRTDLARADVPAARIDDLAAGHQTATRTGAERYVANLRDEAERLAAARAAGGAPTTPGPAAPGAGATTTTTGPPP